MASLEKHAEERKSRGNKTRPGTLKRVLLAFAPYKGQIFLVLIATFLTAALSLVLPLTIPFVFDDALTHRNMSHLLLYALIMAVATVASGITGVMQTYWNNIVGQHVMRDYRNKLYARLQDMSLRFFTSTRTGEIQSRLSNDVGAAQNAVTDTFTSALTSVVNAVGATIAMLYLSPLLTLISFVLLPFFLWTSYKVGNVRRLSGRATQQSLASLNSLMQETLSVSGMLLIKVFGRKKFAQQQFETENQKLTHLGIRQQMVGRWFFMFVNTFFALTPVIVYVFGGWILISQPQNSGITIGYIIAFMAIQSKFFSSFSQSLALQVNIQGALAVFDRIFEYLDLPVEIYDAPDALHLSKDEIRGEITFKDVSFSYKRAQFALLNEPPKHKSGGPGAAAPLPEAIPPVEEIPVRTTLQHISFSAQAGQLVALVGPSGAGKTTITYLLPRLYDPDSGAVEIDGHNVKEVALDTLSTIIGVVTQETYLFHTSVRENLLYVHPQATEAEIIAATKAAAIHDRIMELDEGYDTIVGERGYRLSGGEKQRLAIARVLLKNPSILILDEATSSLDTHSERLIQEALEALMQNRTTIAIAHRLSTILAADLILVMDKGEIVERGTHQDLIEQDGLYARLYQEQFSRQLSEKTIV